MVEKVNGSAVVYMRLSPEERRKAISDMESFSRLGSSLGVTVNRERNRGSFGAIQAQRLRALGIVSASS